MLDIKNTKIYDLEESILRSGYPMDLGSLVKDFDFQIESIKHYLDNKNKGLTEYSFSTDENMFVIGEKHVNRAIKLGNTKQGSGHSNYLKGIKVSFDLKYPEYLSPQLQRYNWFDIVSSQSKMHRITKLDVKESCNKYVTDTTVNQLNYLIKIYNNFESYEKLNNLNKEIYLSISNTETIVSKYELFMYIISNSPLGLEKWMGISTNYMQLRTIYNQRKNHKLKEDYKILCDWIEQLPLFKELCLGVKYE